MSSPIQPQPEECTKRGLDPDTFRGPSKVERIFLPFLREPTLWPIGLVLIAHVVVLVAPLLVWGLRDGGGWSLAALLLPIGLSGTASTLEIRRRGRPGVVTALLVLMWALSITAACLFVRAGLL